MSNPRRIPDDRLTDLMVTRPKKGTLSDRSLSPGQAGSGHGRGPSETEDVVGGHRIVVDDIHALMGRSLDHEAAEWLLRYVVASVSDIRH